MLLPASCLQGPEVDYEAELAVVIGRTAKDVPVASALGHELGYTCANDISARRLQKHGGGGQWVRGKGFDSFCPLGPVLVTTDEISDPQVLGIRCELNGQLMQTGNTSDMIFSVAELISRLSRDTTLLPGTLARLDTIATENCRKSLEIGSFRKATLRGFSYPVGPAISPQVAIKIILAGYICSADQISYDDQHNRYK